MKCHRTLHLKIVKMVIFGYVYIATIKILKKDSN